MNASRIALGTKAVNLAIQHKDLLPIKSQMCAGGCGRKAEQYHHYNGYEDWQLVDVIPVCRYCHSVADRIRNHEVEEDNLPEVHNLLLAIRIENSNHHRRRLYLLKEFKNREYRCCYLVSREGKKPVTINSDLGMAAFSEYMRTKQVELVCLNIECILCGCRSSEVLKNCPCFCHFNL